MNSLISNQNFHIIAEMLSKPESYESGLNQLNSVIGGNLPGFCLYIYILLVIYYL